MFSCDLSWKEFTLILLFFIHLFQLVINCLIIPIRKFLSQIIDYKTESGIVNERIDGRKEGVRAGEGLKTSAKGEGEGRERRRNRDEKQQNKCMNECLEKRRG